MTDTWFTIHRSSLLPALARLSDAIDTRSKIPILSHALLQPSGPVLRLRATNLDLQIDVECEMMSESSFPEVALPAGRLVAILKELPESAELTFGPGRLKDQIGITCGRSAFSLSYLPGSDFPTMGGRGQPDWVEIDGAKLSEALGKASYAVAKMEDRQYLCGFCLHSDKAGTGMVVAATDGHYLARIELPGFGGLAFPPVEDSYPHIILPTDAADPIRKLLDNAKHGARIRVSAEKLSVSYDGAEIQTKLIDGTYPAYERIIPARTEFVAILPREALASSVRRVVAMVDDAKNDGIRLKVTGDKLQIDMLTAEGSFASDVVQGEITAPDGFAVAHSAPRLAKTLSGIRSADIELMLTDEATAIVIRPLDGSPETYVLSAMRPRFVAE